MAGPRRAPPTAAAPPVATIKNVVLVAVACALAPYYIARVPWATLSNLAMGNPRATDARMDMSEDEDKLESLSEWFGDMAAGTLLSDNLRQQLAVVARVVIGVLALIAFSLWRRTVR